MNQLHASSAVNDLLRVLWQNREALPFAWKILTQTTCDGCSFGIRGLRDDIGRGLHVCMPRLNQLGLQITGALDASRLADVGALENLGPDALRRLGRLPYPMLRAVGARGFVRVGWDRAVQLACNAMRDTAPHQMGFVAAGGLTNEAYYVFQKLARVLGTNNVSLCATPAESACLAALHATLGIGAASCSRADLVDTDLIVIFASDLNVVEPALLKCLRSAKKRGTRVIAVHGGAEALGGPYAPPASAPAPSAPTQLIDDAFSVRAGGETAFINGVIKALIAWNKADRDFIAQHTQGFDALAAALAEQSWTALEQRCGLFRSDMQRFAARYRGVNSSVFVYCVQSADGDDAAVNMKAVVNLALARGMLGREKCGILPILCQSGIQGGVDCGMQPDRFPGGAAVTDESARRFSNLWYHPVPANPGLNLSQVIDAALGGKLKFIYSMGFDLLHATCDPQRSAEALGRVRLRVHQAIALNPSHLVRPAGAVLLLPAQTRHEQPGGGTTTSTDRTIRFSPEIPGRHIGESLPDWDIPAAIGRKSMPNGARLFPFRDGRSIRAEIARVLPMYRGIDELDQRCDHLQWGGPQLFHGGKFRGMPGERARFSVVQPLDAGAAETP